jgi:hypothetical protein
MSDFEKRFAPMSEIFRQAEGRVKGGGFCRRSGPLTRSSVCLISMDRGEALHRCRMGLCERRRSSIGQRTVWPFVVVVSAPPGQGLPRIV